MSVTILSAVEAAAKTSGSMPAGVVVSGAAWKNAHWVNSRRTGTVSSPILIAQDLSLPVLKGADARSRRMVRSWVMAKVIGQRAAVAKWRRSLKSIGACTGPDATKAASMYERNTHAIAAKKYASTVLKFTTNPGCGGVNDNRPLAGVWDVKSHRKLTIADIARRPYYSNYYSVQLQLAIAVDSGELSSCVVDPADGFTPSRAMVRRFTLSTSGIVLHLNRYDGGLIGACGSPSVLIRWEDIALTNRGSAIAAFYGHRGAQDRPLPE